VTRADRLLVDAVERDDFKGVTEALAAGANPDSWIVDEELRMPLLTAAAVNGDGRLVELLLSAGATVDLRDGDGRTALSWVSCVGQKERHGAIFEALLAAGADVNAADHRGARPLEWAAYFMNREMASRLVALHAKCRPGGKRTLRRLLGEKSGPSM